MVELLPQANNRIPLSLALRGKVRRWLPTIIAVLGTAIVFLYCGNFFINSQVKGVAKVLPLLVFLAALVFFAVLSADVDGFKSIAAKLRHPIKERFIPRTSTIAFGIIGVSLCLSLLTIADIQSSLNSYISFGAVICCGFVLTRVCPFSLFKKCFSTGLLFLSITSLLFYFFLSLFPFVASPLPLINVDKYYYQNYFYLFITNAYYGTSGGLFAIRNQSIFWEPGVFATHLVAAIALELIFSKKPNWRRVVLFVITLLTTRSSAGYLLLALVIFIFVLVKLRKKSVRIALMSLLGASFFALVLFFNQLAPYLAIIFPTMFSKMASGSISFVSRLQSPLCFLRVWLQSPLFGLGPKGALDAYYRIVVAEGLEIDSGTSTSAALLAYYGIGMALFTIAPLFGILREKRLNWSARITIVLLLVVLMNKENHAEMLTMIVIYFFCMDAPLQLETGGAPSPKRTFLSVLSSGSPDGILLKNILISAFTKGAALIVGFATIPAYNAYFGIDDKYGVWLTLLSILSWTLMFDFGFGNGMRNKLVPLLKNEDRRGVAKMVSSTYVFSGVLSLLILVGGIVFAWTADLNSLFNVAKDVFDPTSLSVAVSILFSSVAVEFFLKTVVSLLNALRKNALASSLMLFSNIVLLLFVVLFKQIGGNKLIVLSIVYFFAVNAPLAAATFYVFSKPLKGVTPSFRLFDWRLCKAIMGLGALFFAIQICEIIIWGANDFLITQFFGPNEVVNYTKYYKLFSTVVGLVVVYQPSIWSASVKAYGDNDWSYIKRLLVLSLGIGSVLILASAVLFLGLQNVFNLWLGANTIQVKPHLAITFFVYAIVFIVQNSILSVYNGLSKIGPMAVVYIGFAVVKIPLMIGLNFWLGASFDWVWLVVFNCVTGIISTAVCLVVIRRTISGKGRLAVKEGKDG